MNATSQAKQFKALDACHQQILEHLAELAKLLNRLKTDSNSAHSRQKAKTIEAFFSQTARSHHLDEECNVFPALLLSDKPEVVQAVQTLKQDHGWIEQNWLNLAPMLRAIAQGEGWADMDELTHSAEIFLSLCHDHVALEESLIYPEAKAHLAQQLAERAKRMAA